MSALLPIGTLSIDGAQLEYVHLGPDPASAPTLVLLHEGLGCVGLWREFPQQLQAATGVGVFAYSRAGYGQSSPVRLPRPLDYMQHEALRVLPSVLEAIGFEKGLLIGHSDGASIATIYAGSVRDERICGLTLIAPHFLVEDVTLRSIADVAMAYRRGELKRRLARWHADPDNAVYGWSGAWLDPAFRHWDISESLTGLRVPIQIVQGENDQYGTTLQIDTAKARCRLPIEVALVPNAAHAPHHEASLATLDAIAGFANRALGNAAPVRAVDKPPRKQVAAGAA